MVIRPYVSADRAAILALRAKHGEEFWFADPDDPINPLTVVAEDEGRIVAAVTARLSAEVFLILDPGYGTSLKRWGVLKRLFAFGLQLFKQKTNVSECYATVALPLGSFAGLLGKLPNFYPDERARYMIPLWNLK